MKRAKKTVVDKSKEQKQQKEKKKLTGRKVCMTPIELGKLVQETQMFFSYSDMNYHQAGKAAARKLNYSQHFGEFVGNALNKDYSRLVSFTGAKGRRKQH